MIASSFLCLVCQNYAPVDTMAYFNHQSLTGPFADGSRSLGESL
jgi:hypothetical protein